MSYYNQFHLNAELKKGIPFFTKKFLEQMLFNANKYANLNLLDDDELKKHPLFKMEWRGMFTISSSYVKAINQSTVDFGFDSIISINCQFQDYTIGVALVMFLSEFFTDSNKQYEGRFLGYMRGEDSNKPQLMYMYSPDTLWKAYEKENDLDDVWQLITTAPEDF